MDRVYVETTVISYLTARPSRDVVIAGHQATTAMWWKTAATEYELYISRAVLAEIQGDPQEASRRLQLIQGMTMLEYTEDVTNLIDIYSQRLGLSGRALADLPHIAFAVAAEIDFLVTWNCSHLASGIVIRRLAKINQEMNRKTPIIGTPDFLLGEEEGVI